MKDRATELEIRINEALFSEARVIACTLVSSANRVLTGRRFGTLFIDEAAQALEPACWIAIRKADRIVLAGDHCQLPPTIKCVEAARGGLDQTLMQEIVQNKPVIVCGDLNVAHKEIDLKNPKTNRKNAGFTDEERAKFTTLLESGFTDTFRYFYPEQEGIYSWWSYRFKAREKNAGWRIDYFLTSDSLKDKLRGAQIHTDILGSDHCPVELTIEL